ARRAGLAGCISASANVTAPEAQAAWSANDAEAPERQARVAELRNAVSAFPIIAATRAVQARISGDDRWERTLPPLVPLDDEQKKALFAKLDSWLAAAAPA
ncbi:MAG: dihydrodipicolinate synthase family protein, partial [Candidatus Eremiobacteraeota bacterium]|nr:dihydrodipicolinate synthase family protein [Candidatus Eremiobacteraeota bacterium]